MVVSRGTRGSWLSLYASAQHTQWRAIWDTLPGQTVPEEAHSKPLQGLEAALDDGDVVLRRSEALEVRQGCQRLVQDAEPVVADVEHAYGLCCGEQRSGGVLHACGSLSLQGSSAH